MRIVVRTVRFRRALFIGLLLLDSAGFSLVAADPPEGNPIPMRAEERIERPRPPQPPLPSRPLAEIRQKASQIRAQIQELIAAGKEEEAARLKPQLAELEQRMSRVPAQRELAEIKERLMRLKRDIQELHQTGRHEAAERLAQGMRDIMAELAPGRPMPPPQAFPPGQAPSEQLGPRQRHLQAAIENLRAAGLNELAQDLERKAAEFTPWRGGPGRPPVGSPNAFKNTTRELQDQIDELRQAVHGLKAQLNDWCEKRRPPVD